MQTTSTILFLLVFICNSFAQAPAPKAKAPSDCSVFEIDSLLEIFKANRAFENFIPYAEVGAEKASKQFGNQDTTYARMLFFLGFGYQIRQNFAAAEKYLTQAIEIQKIKTPSSPKYANSLNNLAILYGSRGNDIAAEPLYITAMNIQKKVFGKKHPDYAKSLNNLALLYTNRGDYAIAEPLFKEAMEIRKEIFGERHPEYSASLNNLALLYDNMGNYSLSESLYKEALKIKKEVFGEKHPDYAESMNNLAELYRETGNYAAAEPLLKQALNIYKDAFGPKHPTYALILNNLAVLYSKMNNYALAEALYKETIKTRKETLGEKHPMYANSLNNLGGLYYEMGNYALSESLYKEGSNILKELLGTKHPDYCRILNNLAFLYRKIGNTLESWNYVQQSIVANSGKNMSLQISKAWADSLLLCEFGSIKEMETTLVIAYNLLAINSNALRNESQVIVADLALQLLQKSRNDFSDEKDKLRTLGQSSDWVLHSLAALSKTSNDEKIQAEKSFAYAEQAKSVLLLEAIQTTRVQSFSDLPDSLIQEEKFLQKQKAIYQANILEKRPEFEIDSLRNLLNTLDLKIKDFKTKIEKTFPKYASLKYNNKTTEAKEIQASLDDKTALLEYVIGDSVLYIFYIDKNNVKLLRNNISSKFLTTKTQDLRLTLSDYEQVLKESPTSYQKYTESAFWFYENLVAPALKSSANPNIKNLIIVTDGELGHLPFEAFLVEPAPQVLSDFAKMHYLIKDYNISYNYSATLWKTQLHANQAKKQHNGQLLAMAANYDIKKSVSRLPAHQRLRESLLALPEARKEVEILSEVFNGFFALDEMASEKTFKEKAGDYAVIHLAMHGLLDEKEAILANLVFTEDGDSLENNLLHAYEISKMKLNADLVVLSACETGYGRFERGNGIASLAQAFSYAGAPSLIVSLWQVNDYATSEIMKTLYGHLSTGMPKDLALRQAKLDYIQKSQGLAAHPAFWSPFILMGNTDAIALKTKGGWLWWGIGAVAFLGFGFWWTKSKK